MAIKELFYDNRPRVLFDPRASQRIDPRFTFTRNSTGTDVDVNGIIQTAGLDEPRFNYDPDTGEFLGLLIEESRTNVTYPSDFSQYFTYTNPAAGVPTRNYGTVPDATVSSCLYEPSVSAVARNTQGAGIAAGTYTVSVFYKGDKPFAISGPGASSALSDIQTFPNGWTRAAATLTFTGGGYLDLTVLAGTSVELWGIQSEVGSFPTSYIPTSGSTVTRAQDLLSVEPLLPATGSIYIDARALSANENDTLLSLKNDSNNKIDLAYLSNTATYNSLALIANYDGVSKISLPLSVPTTDRERNIITYGANNYQYGRDLSRFAPSLSSSVPTNLNKLSIGHDAVDPTKAFNGYINTVYAWSGELTPEVAEALVRGEIDAIDADTYSPTGPAGSLALVINTQGATADGEKTFTLPAESAANDNDIVITWGDGTESGLEDNAAELNAVGLTHDYSAAGIYPVWVEGKMENIKYDNISNAEDLVTLAAWGTGDMFTSPSTMNGAFYGCSQMVFSNSARITNKPDTSAVTDWENAFRDCSSITGTFPTFNFSAATDFGRAWSGCSSMTAFVAAGDQTQNVTNFSYAWNGCSSLTSFPLINTSSGTDFTGAWYDCSSIPNTFPSINTSSGTNFNSTWRGCSSLTGFPSINTSSGTNFNSTWRNCSNISGTFPFINTSLGTTFGNAWNNCSSLTGFPLIDTSSGELFSYAWSGCSSLTSFPLIDTSSGTDFNNTWNNCSSLTSFPLIDTSLGTNFSRAWRGCSSLTSFPASFFDSWSATPVDECFYQTWDGCTSLTAASVDNILVSIAASGVSAPSGTDTDDKKIIIDYDGTTLPGTTATAITTLKSRNWDIYLNNVQQ